MMKTTPPSRAAFSTTQQSHKITRARGKTRRTSHMLAREAASTARVLCVCHRHVLVRARSTLFSVTKTSDLAHQTQTYIRDKTIWGRQRRPHVLHSPPFSTLCDPMAVASAFTHDFAWAGAESAATGMAKILSCYDTMGPRTAFARQERKVDMSHSHSSRLLSVDAADARGF